MAQERDRRPMGPREEMDRPQFGPQEARRRFGNQFQEERMDRPQFGSQEARRRFGNQFREERMDRPQFGPQEAGRRYRDRAERWAPQRRTPVICWTCDEPGHVSRSCPAFQEFLASRREKARNLVPKEQRDGVRSGDAWALN